MRRPAIPKTERPLWHEQLILTRDITIPGERTDFYRRARSGEFVRITRGAYLPAAAWEPLDRHDRYRALVAASARPASIFSHHSAAALWRLPWIGSWPRRVHLAEQPALGAFSSGRTVRHATGVPDSSETIDGLRVTALARTVVDLASTSTFEQGTAVADAALRRSMHPIDGVPATRVTSDDLLRELERIPLSHGAVKARTVITFANGLADRPGESLSRVSIHRARLPMPELQVPLRGRSGRTWTVDFWWPRSNLIGEFDGEWKYTEARFANGRTSHQILLDEKYREDDLRAVGHSLVRWDWDTALSPARLRTRLVDAGLR